MTFKVNKCFVFLGYCFVVKAYTKSNNPNIVYGFGKDGLVITVRRNNQVFAVYTKDRDLDNGNLTFSQTATFFEDISLKEAKALFLNCVIEHAHT